MQWLDRLLGRPTLEGLVRTLRPRLHALGVTDLRVDLAMREITGTHAQGRMQMYLGNLLHDWSRAPRCERDAVIDRYLAGVVRSAAGPVVATSWEDARPLLMPVVRHVDDLALAALATRRAAALDGATGGTDTPAAGDHDVASAPFVGDLRRVLVLDSPDAIELLPARRLHDWGVDFETAWAEALDHLRGLPEAGGWQRLDDGVWSGEWGDAYESSRLLLPDLIHRLGVPEPVALVPFRNALLVTSARDPAAFAHAVAVAGQALGENTRWLSFDPLRLSPSGEWVPHGVPPEAATALRELQRQTAARTYESQKELLDDLHRLNGTDVFVASVGLLRGAEGLLSTYAVWPDGVDTLLPEVDLVALAQGEGESATHALVPWAALRRHAVDVMTDSGETPRRWRVRAFPAGDALARLREAAVA